MSIIRSDVKSKILVDNDFHKPDMSNTETKKPYQKNSVLILQIAKIALV